jgi:hypothetical protein
MKNKDEEILLNIYRDLYANSEPKGNFDELFKNATINELGQKEIPFMDYEITNSKENEIFKKHLVGKGFTKLKQQSFINTVLLGCSPRTKI